MSVRFYQAVILHWDTQQGVNCNGEGTLASRRQLQEKSARLIQTSQYCSLLGLFPGSVV